MPGAHCSGVRTAPHRRSIGDAAPHRFLPGGKGGARLFDIQLSRNPRALYPRAEADGHTGSREDYDTGLNRAAWKLLKGLAEMVATGFSWPELNASTFPNWRVAATQSPRRGLEESFQLGTRRACQNDGEKSTAEDKRLRLSGARGSDRCAPQDAPP